jgi:TetR/AcrR family transcriptional repressor of nem operon
LARSGNLAGLGKMLQAIDQGLHIQGLAGATDAQKDRVISAVMAGLRAES